MHLLCIINETMNIIMKDRPLKARGSLITKKMVILPLSQGIDSMRLLRLLNPTHPPLPHIRSSMFFKHQIMKTTSHWRSLKLEFRLRFLIHNASQSMMALLLSLSITEHDPNRFFRLQLRVLVGKDKNKKEVKISVIIQIQLRNYLQCEITYC